MAGGKMVVIYPWKMWKMWKGGKGGKSYIGVSGAAKKKPDRRSISSIFKEYPSVSTDTH